MKRFAVLVTLLGLAAAPGWAAAQEGHHEHTGAGHAAGAQTVTGEVVDLACYLGHGALGPGHRDCAEKCIASGLPVGIKTADGLYLVVGSEHGSANGDLAPLAAKQVTATGKTSERDGVHLLAMEKIAVNE